MRWRVRKICAEKTFLGEKVRRELMSMLSHFLGGSSEFDPLFFVDVQLAIPIKKRATQLNARLVFSI